ncbi:uncharacterized [Tachysurus ichikawai]
MQAGFISPKLVERLMIRCLHNFYDVDTNAYRTSVGYGVSKGIVSSYRLVHKFPDVQCGKKLSSWCYEKMISIGSLSATFATLKETPAEEPSQKPIVDLIKG